MAEQGSWRWYTDATPDGSMTALAAEKAVPTLGSADMQNGIIRLRVQVVENLGSADNNRTLALQYSGDGGTTWNIVQAQTPATNQEGWWFQVANGAATDGNTIGTQFLTGTTASGKYHETITGLESLAANAVQEVDFAIRVHWPPPDTTVRFRLTWDGTGLAVAAGSVAIELTTSTAANRPNTITKLDADGAQKTSREIRFGPQVRLYYALGRWWFFTVQVNTPTSLSWYSWTGSGGWSTATTQAFTNDGHQTRSHFAFADIGGSSIVHAMHGSSSTTRRGRRGVLASNGTISWSAEWSVTQTTDRHYEIAIDDGGYVWIAGCTAGVGVWACRSTNADSGASWTSGFQAAKTAADTGIASGDIVSVLGLGSDQAIVAWRSTNVLKYAVVTDAGGFGAVANINATTNAGPEDWGWSRKGNFVYLVHSDSTGAGGNWVLRVYNISGASWSTGTSPGVSGQVSSNDGIPVTVNANANILYAFGTFIGTGGGQDRKIQVKTYTWALGSEASGTWSALADVGGAGGRGNGDHLSAPRLSGTDGQTMVAFAFNDDDAVAHPRTAEYHTLAVASGPRSRAIPIGA